MIFPGGGGGGVKIDLSLIETTKKASTMTLKGLKLINDYYCRTVRRRRNKSKFLLVKWLLISKSSNVK